MMKFHHIFCWGNFGETDSIPIISQRGNGNFRFPSISHRNLSISLKFPSKNYGEILVFFANHYQSTRIPRAIGIKGASHTAPTLGTRLSQKEIENFFFGRVLYPGYTALYGLKNDSRMKFEVLPDHTNTQWNQHDLLMSVITLVKHGKCQ